jgi:hypothetical protein
MLLGRYTATAVSTVCVFVISIIIIVVVVVVEDAFNWQVYLASVMDA